MFTEKTMEIKVCENCAGGKWNGIGSRDEAPSFKYYECLALVRHIDGRLVSDPIPIKLKLEGAELFTCLRKVMHPATWCEENIIPKVCSSTGKNREMFSVY